VPSGELHNIGVTLRLKLVMTLRVPHVDHFAKLYSPAHIPALRQTTTIYCSSVTSLATEPNQLLNLKTVSKMQTVQMRSIAGKRVSGVRPAAPAAPLPSR
jgi:hypothetical protein